MKQAGIRLTKPIIEAINEELEYQESLTAANRADAEDHGVAGQLVTLSVYANKANEAWVNNAGCDPALDQLRKVAAIAIRALEMYGCPRRNKDKK